MGKKCLKRIRLNRKKNRIRTKEKRCKQFLNLFNVARSNLAGRKSATFHIDNCWFHSFAANGPLPAVFPRVADGRRTGLTDAVRRGAVGPASVPPHLDQVLTKDVAGP